jgi:CRP-like cAMP-binding protein
MKHGLPSCAPCPVPNAQFRGVCPGGPSFLAEDSLGDATRDYSAKLLPEPGYWIPDLLVRDVVLGLDQVSVVSSPGTRIRDQGRRSDRGGYTRLCAEENADEICVGTTLERDWVSQGDTYQYAGMCGGYVKTLVHGPFQEDAIFRFDRDENGFITKDEFVEACTRLEEHEKHENSTAIPGDCSRFPKPGAEQLGLDDFTKWWLGPDTNAERLRNIYTDKTLGDTDVTLLDGVKKHFQTCVQLGAELGEDVLNELRCVQPPNFCRANHTGLYCQECANGTKLLDDGTCCEEKGDEEKVVWKSLVDVMTTPLLYAIYFIHRSRDVQAADSILTTIIFHLQTLSLFTGVNVDSQLTNHLDMGFVSSEALGSTLSTVLNFVNLNGEVYNQLYQLNELNVADLAMNLQQTAKNPCAVNFCPLLTEAPAVSEFKSTCGLGGNGRVSIYWAYLEATAVPGEPGGTEGGCYVAIFWSYLSMPAITIVYMCIFLRLRSKLHDHRSCLFKGVSDSGVRRTGLSRFAYWITRRTFCRPFTTEEYDLYLAEQDLIKRRASWCRGEHLKCCCSLGQCCCFSEDHQAGRRHVTCCKALSWAGVIPFGLPWLPAELHRCAVSMYIYQFLPQLQLLQGHILWRKVDITEQTDLNVDGSEQYQYTVLADSELEWGSAEHLPTLLASMSLLFVHFMLIGYLLQGVQQETLWHKRTTTGISKSATQIFKMYGETKLFLQNSEDAKRADQKNIDLLKNVPKLQSMDDETLRLIEAASKTTSYAYGETVTTLEEAANVLYIVETGILCSSTENESHLPDQIFKRGDYFGSAMLSDTTMVDAAAIKVSTTDATCLQIDCKQLENDGILQAITDASQEVAELTEADGTASRRRRSRMNSFQDASMTNRGKWQWAQQKGGKRLTVSARNYLEVRGMAEESEIVEKKSGGQEIKRLKAGRVTDDGDVRTFVVGQETLRFSPVYGVYRPGTCRTKFIWCGQAVCDEGDIGQADTDRESPTTLRNQQKDKCRCSVENGSGYAWWFVVDILRKIALVVATTSRTDSRNVATFFCLCASVAGYLWANPFPDPAANLFEACSSFLLLYHLYAMQISGSPDGTSAEPFSPSPYLLTTYFLLGGVGLMLARTRFGGAWSVYLEFKLRNCCRRAVYKYEVLAGDKAAYSEQTLRLAESAFHETQEKLQSMLLEYHSVQLRAENAREIAALEEEFTIAKHRYDLEIALMHKRNREEQLRKLATRESLRSAIRKVRFETRTIGIINSGVQQSQDEDYAHRVVFIKGLHQLDGFNYDADLRTIFSQYGTVTQVLVRRRIRKVETDYGSWGLVTFADASMASKAVEAPVEVQTKAVRTPPPPTTTHTLNPSYKRAFFGCWLHQISCSLRKFLVQCSTVLRMNRF